MAAFTPVIVGALSRGARGGLLPLAPPSAAAWGRSAAATPPSRRPQPQPQPPTQRRHATAATGTMSTDGAPPPPSPLDPTPPPPAAVLPTAAHERAREVVAFWFDTPTPLAPLDARPHLGATLWFPAGDAAAAADTAIASRFAPDVEAALAGDAAYAALADGPDASPWSALALVLLLDQFPRSLYRGTARAFAGDAAALGVAEALLATPPAGGGRGAPPLVDRLPWAARSFAAMPLMHAEDAGTVGRCVDALAAWAAHPAVQGEAGAGVRQALEGGAAFGRQHHAIVARFGRYPYRNAVLGRETTAEEAAWVAEGGNSFGQ